MHLHHSARRKACGENIVCMWVCIPFYTSLHLVPVCSRLSVVHRPANSISLSNSIDWFSFVWRDFVLIKFDGQTGKNDCALRSCLPIKFKCPFYLFIWVHFSVYTIPSDRFVHLLSGNQHQILAMCLTVWHMHNQNAPQFVSNTPIFISTICGLLDDSIWQSQRTSSETSKWIFFCTDA